MKLPKHEKLVMKSCLLHLKCFIALSYQTLLLVMVDHFGLHFLHGSSKICGLDCNVDFNG